MISAEAVHHGREVTKSECEQSTDKHRAHVLRRVSSFQLEGKGLHEDTMMMKGRVLRGLNQS